jgi:hypothetical protein
MLAEFDKPVAIWLHGEVIVLSDKGYIHIGVRVARVDGRETGLAFHAEDDGDRLAIGRLVDFASQHSKPECRLP